MRPKSRHGRLTSFGDAGAGVIRPCALVRVSSEEQIDQFSLPMQTLKITEYCQQHLGVELPETALFREEGVSGRPGTLKKRPGLSAALEGCRTGQYTHLLVHKLDRLGRNVGLVSSVLETLEEQGITFISVQDRVDASTAAGRLYITIFIAIGQWYSDNLSEETKKGKEGRKRAGLYNGVLPFGAMRGEGLHAAPQADLRPLALVGADGILRETTNHAGLLQAFDWCALGHTAREIAVKLNGVGYRTVGTWGSNPFSKDTVQRLLGNRFYLGELPDGEGDWVPGKHEALLPRALWDQAQQARARHRTNPQTLPGVSRVHVLGGGLLRCGICWAHGRSSALHIAKSNSAQNTAYFTCYGRTQGYVCTQPAVPDSKYEAQVSAFFDAFALPDDYAERIVALFRQDRQRQSGTSPQAGPDLHAQRAQLTARLERQQQLYELGDWTRERFLQARAEVLAELAEADRSLPQDQEGRPLGPEVLERLGAYVREVRVAWRDADKAHRRLLVRTLFEQLWVVGDRIVAAKPVAQFAPFFRLLQATATRNTDRGMGIGCASGEDVDMDLVYLDPTSAWASDTSSVAAMAEKIAHDDGRHGRLGAAVQTGGPDGIYLLTKHSYEMRFPQVGRTNFSIFPPLSN